MKLVEVVETVQYWSAAASIILNALLTYLIIKESPKQLGTYKYLMLYVVWFEVAYSIIDIIVSPSLYVHGPVYMVFVNVKKTNFEKETIRFLISVWCGFYGFSIGMFVLPFYYRYLVAIGSNTLKTLNDWRIVLWFTFPMVYGVLWFLIETFLLYQTAEINEYVRSAILSDLDMNIDDIVLTGPFFFHKAKNGNYVYDSNSLFGISIAWTTVGISITSIIYFGWKCYKKLRKLMNNTSKLRGLQDQLFYALLIETIVPVILMHMPVSMLFFLTLFEQNVGIMANILSVTVALFPVIDPLPTMFIIKNYRTRIFRLVCLKSKTKTESAVKLPEPLVIETIL